MGGGAWRDKLGSELVTGEREYREGENHCGLIGF